MIYWASHERRRPLWEAAHRPAVYDLPELSAADPGGSAIVSPDLSEDLSPPSGAGAAVRDGPGQSPSVDSGPLGGAAGAGSPLLATMGPNTASSAPRIRLSKRAVIAARKGDTRSKTCGCSRPPSPSSDEVESIMPTRKPRGRALTRTQQAANRRIARRRVRIEHVNRSVKRYCIVPTLAGYGRLLCLA